MEVKIQRKIIDCAKRNLPETLRWLEEAVLDSSDINHPKCYGKFRINNSVFSNKPLVYMGCPQAIICIGQIAYAAWAELLEENIVNAHMGVDEFLNLPPNAMKIVEVERMKFKRKTKTDNEVNASISLDDYRAGDTGDMTYIITKFDFENRSCFGTAKFTIQRDFGRNDVYH